MIEFTLSDYYLSCMQQILLMYLTKDLMKFFATEKCAVTVRGLAVKSILK